MTAVPTPPSASACAIRTQLGMSNSQALSIPVSLEQHLENLAASQPAQQFTYAMLAPQNQLRSFTAVSDHGMGDYSSGFLFDQTYTPNGGS